MSKIKFILKKMGGNQLIFQILKMDERFRKQDRADKNIEHTCYHNIDEKPMKVISADQPCLGIDPNAIYLWGADRTYDYKIVTRWCGSRKVLDQTHAKILKAITDWANNWHGFHEHQPVPSEDKDTFEL